MQSEVRGHAMCPKCERLTLIRTAARLGLWECINPDCGCFVDFEGDTYAREIIKEVKN